MKNFIVILFVLIYTLQGCKKEETKVEPCPSCPIINKLSPNHGRTGDEITIEGENLGSFDIQKDEILFNSQKVTSFTEAPNDNSLKVKVPERCGDGPVIVTIGSLRSDELNEAPHFTYDFVTITDIKPNRGKPGDKIQIFGENFFPAIEDNIVVFSDDNLFDTVFAEIAQANENILEVIVPENGISGPIQVISDGHTANAPFFKYEGEVRIDSISPDHGRKGDLITLYGANFRLNAEENMVKFAGDVYGNVIEGNDSILKVEVPKGAEKGEISIELDGLLTNGPVFTYIYTIQVSTLAGTGYAGNTNGAGSNAQFNLPSGIAISASDELYIADFVNQKIRRIEADGTTHNYAGTSLGYKNGDKDNTAKFWNPSEVSFDQDGNLLVVDHGNHRIRKIETSTGYVSNFYGNGSPSLLFFPHSVLTDNEGNVYIGDTGHDRIVKVFTDGSDETFAGSSGGYKDGASTSAKFDFPRGISLDQNGNIIVADRLNNRIRKITPNRIVSTISGDGNSGFNNGSSELAQFNRPTGTTVGPKGNIYVADAENHMIRKITPAGEVSTLAGDTIPDFINGDEHSARFNTPVSLAFDSQGNLYVVDKGNHAIRKITIE